MLRYVPLTFVLAACLCAKVSAQKLQPADSIPTLSFVVAGDMMQHALQFQTALRPDGTYDYSECFSHVTPLISEADVAIANLETTFGGAPYSGYPGFSTPNSFATAIRDAGFDILLTANNHSADKRSKGLRQTLEVLDSLGIGHIGTYRDTAAWQREHPYLIEAKGFRVALLCWTYGTNGIRVPSPFVVNMLDTVQMARDIEQAKRMNVDAIIAFPHWGVEYELLPSARQVKLAEWMLREGVTHIVGGHPHVVQPIEVRKDTTTNERHLVAYSLGNYTSNITSVNCSGGIQLHFSLTRDSLGHCILGDTYYRLIWQDRPALSKHRQFEVLPMTYPDSLMRQVEKSRRDDFVRNARQLFSQHNIGIEERR